jgi:hypothetical protein
MSRRESEISAHWISQAHKRLLENNTRSSNLVTSATKGYRCFNLAFMENSVMTVMVVAVEKTLETEKILFSFPETETCFLETRFRFQTSNIGNGNKFPFPKIEYRPPPVQTELSGRPTPKRRKHISSLCGEGREGSTRATIACPFHNESALSPLSRSG